MGSVLEENMVLWTFGVNPENNIGNHTMTTIRQEDLIQSIADGLQYISYYHPVDYIKALTAAWEREQSPSAKDAMAQILVNSRMCAEGQRPICQDTGMVVVFLEVGMDLRFEGDMGLEDMINEGVRRGYNNPDNVLRASMVADPAGARKNTGDNTPNSYQTGSRGQARGKTGGQGRRL